MNALISHQCTCREGANDLPTARPSEAVLPLVAILQQPAEVIGSLTDEQYVRKPIGVVPGSIGGHVRHCLDHIEALLAGARTGRLDYDHRQRGTEVESRRHVALDTLQRLERQLLSFFHSLDRPLRLNVMLSSASSPIEVETSVGRELAFVLSHTIHHNSLVGVMVNLLGLPLPERFGYAPSTIAHLEKTSC